MNNEKYKCPECQSDSIRFKFKVKNHNNYSYANVTKRFNVQVVLWIYLQMFLL